MIIEPAALWHLPETQRPAKNAEELKELKILCSPLRLSAFAVKDRQRSCLFLTSFINILILLLI